MLTGASVTVAREFCADLDSRAPAATVKRIDRDPLFMQLASRRLANRAGAI